MAIQKEDVVRMLRVKAHKTMESHEEIRKNMEQAFRMYGSFNG